MAEDQNLDQLIQRVAEFERRQYAATIDIKQRLRDLCQVAGVDPELLDQDPPRSDDQ